MKQAKIHPDFRLNEQSFSSTEALLVFSEKINLSIHTFLSDWFNDKEYVVVNTSGSTGKPKPIQLKKEFMINSAKATGVFFDLPEKTSALLCLSTDYIAGKMMLVRALTLGWELDIVEPIANPLEEVNKQYNFSAMVPLQLQNSINELGQVKKLIVGGGVVSNELINAVQNCKTEVFATYGMTETITHIAVKKLNNFSQDGLISASYYTVLPNVKITQDSRRCLVIDAPKVSKEKVITNDVVNLISTAEFEWLGRFDNVINSGGIKLHPEKIEEKLSNIISNRFFVIGIPDEKLGEKLVLLVEGEKQMLDFNQLSSLGKYEIPKEVYFVDEFVETETKKIQRKKTLDLLNL